MGAVDIDVQTFADDSAFMIKPVPNAPRPLFAESLTRGLPDSRACIAR